MTRERFTNILSKCFTHTKKMFLCFYLFLKILLLPQSFHQLNSIYGQFKSRILCNCDKESMSIGSFTCVLRTHFKDVIDILFSYSLIKNNYELSAYEIWISVGMNDMNYDVVRRKGYLFMFPSRCIDNKALYGFQSTM